VPGGPNWGETSIVHVWYALLVSGLEADARLALTLFAAPEYHAYLHVLTRAIDCQYCLIRLVRGCHAYVMQGRARQVSSNHSAVSHQLYGSPRRWVCEFIHEHGAGRLKRGDAFVWGFQGQTPGIDPVCGTHSLLGPLMCPWTPPTHTHTRPAHHSLIAVRPSP
jgi:hypothetical protein